MSDVTQRMALNLAAAALAGALVGWERSYFGRAAGLRTHVLVALGCASVMVIAVDPARLAPAFPPGTLRMDPGRLVQGLMAGIGFLGGGVIVKEGVSIYGLTNAASIWLSAALGIVLGLGFYVEGAVTTAASLIVLVGFRWLELKLPRQVYAIVTFRFEAAKAPTQDELIAWITARGGRLNHLCYRKVSGGRQREFSGTLQVRREQDFMRLDPELDRWDGLLEYDFARNNK